MSDEETVEMIARVAHEANRAYCEAVSMRERASLPQDGEDEIPSRWNRTTDEDRSSKREGVRRALTGATLEELHQSWCEHKLSHGWRYGAVKDEARKEHPCLLPYDKLPEHERRKDALFAAVVGALA